MGVESLSGFTTSGINEMVAFPEPPAYESPVTQGEVLPAAEAAGNSSSGIADQNSHYNWGFRKLVGDLVEVA